LIHFDTGKYLESVVHDPKNCNNSKIQKERLRFDTGILLTPKFVLDLDVVKTKVAKIARSDFGIVFSGSPRTLFEAKGLVPTLERVYGRKNIISFILKVNDGTATQRNTSRLVCELCGNTIIKTLLPRKLNLKICPICGSKLYRRTLDNHTVMRVRLKEYKNRTKPIFAFLKKRGYALNEIDGEGEPKDVFSALRSIVMEKIYKND